MFSYFLSIFISTSICIYLSDCFSERAIIFANHMGLGETCSLVLMPFWAKQTLDLQLLKHRMRFCDHVLLDLETVLYFSEIYMLLVYTSW